MLQQQMVKKYTGMSNVSVDVEGTGVILKVTKGGTKADNKWIGIGGLIAGVKNDMHLKNLTKR